MPEEAPGSRYRILAVGALVLLSFAAMFLAPMLKTGYISDDVVSSLLPGMARFTGETMVSRTLAHIRSSMLEGRFYPLAWVQYYAVFFSMPNVLVYKTFLLGMVLIDLLLFVIAIRKIGKDDSLALLAATLTVPLFQFRAFFDPILAFHGLLQFVVAGLLLSVLSLQRFLERGGSLWLALSAGSFLACNLAYEVCYPLVFLYLPLILHGRPDWRTRWTTFRPFVATVAACASLSFLMRWLHPSPSYIHGVSHNPAAIVVAMTKQTSAALPLSYFLADPAGLFSNLHSLPLLLRWMARPDAAILAVLASAIVWLCLRSRSPRGDAIPRPRAFVLLQIGLLLAVLPATMIAISSRYQTQIRFGKGYLPVYIQCFGVGLLLALGIRAGLSKLGNHRSVARLARCTVLALVGFTTCVSFRANRVTAISLVSPPGTRSFNLEAAWNDGVWHDQRINLEAALHAGLLDDVPERSAILLENEYPGWHDAPFSLFFYAMHSSKVLATIPPSARTPSSPKYSAHASYLAQIPGTSASSYWLRDVSLGKAGGYVILAPLENDPRRGDSPLARGLSLFVRHARMARPGPMDGFLVVGQSRTGTGGSIEFRSDRDLVKARSEAGWTLYRLRPGPHLLDPSTITLQFGTSGAERLAKSRERPTKSRR